MHSLKNDTVTVWFLMALRSDLNTPYHVESWIIDMMMLHIFSILVEKRRLLLPEDQTSRLDLGPPTTFNFVSKIKHIILFDVRKGSKKFRYQEIPGSNPGRVSAPPIHRPVGPTVRRLTTEQPFALSPMIV
jgi:hypothetical protein